MANEGGVERIEEYRAMLRDLEEIARTEIDPQRRAAMMNARTMLYYGQHGVPDGER